jgi:hypothetical protein
VILRRRETSAQPVLEQQPPPGDVSSAGSLRVFLNYRRDDSSGHAGRLYDDLTERFEEHEFFMDIDKIEPGVDFGDAIDRALDRCDVVLALIGRQWLTATDASGQRRLDSPDDYVRLELEAALSRDTRLIPICVQGAGMPNSADLPDPIRALARRHALEISDTRWRHDVESLAAILERLSATRIEAARTAEEARSAEEQERQARDDQERQRQELEEAEQRDRARRDEEQRRELLAAEQARAEAERLERAAKERRRAELAEEERRKAERAEEERRKAEHAEEERLRAQRAEAERKQRGDERARQQEQKLKVAPVRPAPGTVEVADRPARDWRRPVAIAAALGILVLVIGGVWLARSTGGGGDDPPIPAATGSPQVRGEPRPGAVLRATRGTWENAPTSFAYAWQRCPEDRSCRAIGGATSPSYKLRESDAGQRVRVVVTASNDRGSAVRASAMVKVAAKPTTVRLPTLAGGTEVGDTLTATSGAYRGTEPLSHRYVWKRCNAQGQGCTTIAGVTGLRYRLVTQDVGSTIRIDVHTSNSAGTTVARSRPTATVKAAPVVEQPAETTTTQTEPDVPTCPPDCVKP